MTCWRSMPGRWVMRRPACTCWPCTGPRQPDGRGNGRRRRGRSIVGVCTALMGPGPSAGWLMARVDQTRGRCHAEATPGPGSGGRDAPAPLLPRSGPVASGDPSSAWAEVRTPELVDGPSLQSHEAYLVSEVSRLRVDGAGRFLRAWQQQARLHIGWIDPDSPEPGDVPRARVDMSQDVRGLVGPRCRAVLRRGRHHRPLGDRRRGRRAVPGRHVLRRRRHQPRRAAGRRRGPDLRSARAGPAPSMGAPRPSVEVICDERTLLGLPIDDY